MIRLHWQLRKRAHSTNFAQTEVLVEKIIRLSIGTGSLTGTTFLLVVFPMSEN